MKETVVEYWKDLYPEREKRGGQLKVQQMNERRTQK